MGRIAVIGAKGQIGRLLVDELAGRGHHVVAVASSWPGSTPADTGPVERRTADATDATAMAAALAGCDSAVATLGLPYRADVWQAQWVPLMRAVADASATAGARLVYLDNLYGYGPVATTIDEDTPLRPSTGMGRARAEVAEMLLARQQDVVIGRAADFLGPGAATSSVGDRFFAGVTKSDAPVRKAEWMGDPTTRHCWAGTPTVAASLATLADTGDLEGRQVWMLPVHGPMTGVELCERLGRVAGCRVVPKPLPGLLLKVGGLVKPEIRAVADMLYQGTADQVVSDARWRAAFPVGGPDLDTLLAQALRHFGGTPAAVPAA